jgi:hypothetical protein
MKCPGSNIQTQVSDYNVLMRKAPCPVCDQQVKIMLSKNYSFHAARDK